MHRQDLKGTDDRLDSLLGPESKDETIARLRDEVRGWKRAANREGTIGAVLGGGVALMIGIWIGTTL